MQRGSERRGLPARQVRRPFCPKGRTLLCIFYHLESRSEILHENFVMELMPIGLDDEPKRMTVLNVRFPEGVSQFGYTLIHRHQEIYKWKRRQEILYERIRFQCYPRCPSRYVSFFACGSLEDAKRLRPQFYDHSCEAPRDRIWKVEGVPAFRADMMLFPCPKSTGPHERACDYWSGKRSKEPLIEYLLK